MCLYTLTQLFHPFWCAPSTSSPLLPPCVPIPVRVLVAWGSPANDLTLPIGFMGSSGALIEEGMDSLVDGWMDPHNFPRKFG